MTLFKILLVIYLCILVLDLVLLFIQKRRSGEVKIFAMLVMMAIIPILHIILLGIIVGCFFDDGSDDDENDEED